MSYRYKGKIKKVKKKKNPAFFDAPNQKSLHSHTKIEGTILSYNILIEFYIMINKFNLILQLHVSNPSNNLMDCIHSGVGIDERPIPILVFISVA